MNTESYSPTIERKPSVESYATSDQISTLNEEIISQLVGHSLEDSSKYPYSRVIDIIHRTIPAENVTNYTGKINRGQKNTSGNIRSVINTNITVSNWGESSVNITALEFPPEKKEIFESLDALYQRLSWDEMEEDEVFQAAAFFMIMSASTHPYLDGSGRASVGASKFLIERATSRTLRLDVLEKHSTKLGQLLASGTIAMLPDEINPTSLLGTLGPGESVEVNMSTLRINMAGDKGLLGKHDLAMELGENMMTNIESYHVKADDYTKYCRDFGLYDARTGSRMPNRTLQNYSEQLAELLKYCSG